MVGEVGGVRMYLCMCLLVKDSFCARLLLCLHAYILLCLYASLFCVDFLISSPSVQPELVSLWVSNESCCRHTYQMPFLIVSVLLTSQK